MVGGGNADTKDSPTQPEPWVAITQGERTLYEILFYSQGPVDGYILGEGVRELLLKSGLSLTTLSQIWNLADVSNDNVLNVHEFSLVMHLVRGRKAGLVVPQTLPRILTPPKVSPLAPPPMTQQEKDAYLRVFQALDVKRNGFIDGDVATALLKSSGLSDDVITSIWDVADFGRDGRLNPEELAIAGHLVRHVKAGGSLDGPVDIFQYSPQHVSPISLLARKRRVAEYQEHKQRLMSLKETRKQQSTREAKRLELVKNKIKCLEELAILLRKLEKPDVVSEAKFDDVLNKDKEEVKKQEEIVFRLKKEHEKVRQETVKIILGEHVFNEDNRIIKAETDELNKRLLTSHSHATKDPDPFHQLYEQRKEKRQGSTIKDLDKIDIHIPFEFSPFDLAVTPETLPSGARILQDSSGTCDPDVMSVIADVKGFGDGFMQDWGGLTTASATTTTTEAAATTSSSSSSTSSSTPSGTMSSTTVLSSGAERKEFDDDEIFLEVEESHDLWPILDGSNDCLLGLTDDQVVSLKAKLNDLRNELKQLNTGHRKLIFRDPEDYTARQRAKEAEEVSDRGRINRRSVAERFRNTSSGSVSGISRSSHEGSGSGVRYRPTSDRSPSETAQAVRDYRLKRRSQNLDSASASSSPDSIRRTISINQDGVLSSNNNSSRRHVSSSLGSPSVSDEASLSRQSSLSSTDRPVANTPSPSPANVNQPPPQSTSSKSDRIVEEETVQVSSNCVVNAAPPPSPPPTVVTSSPTISSPPPPATTDSSILKLKSNRRKDELSLALGSTALGRHIHVEPAPVPVSKPSPSEVKQPSAKASGKSKNTESRNTSVTKRANNDVSNGQITTKATAKQSPSQTTGPEPNSKVSSSKKSRAPLPPSGAPVKDPSNKSPVEHSSITSIKSQPSSSSSTIKADTGTGPNNQSKGVNSPNNTVSSSKRNSITEKAKDTKVSEQEDFAVPRRPPRIKKTSTSENRNSGSFNSDSSSISSSLTESFDRGPTSPTTKADPKTPASSIPTEDTMSSTNVRSVSSTPKLQAPSKKRPAPSPTAQQINEASSIRSPTLPKDNPEFNHSKPASRHSLTDSSPNVPRLNLSTAVDSHHTDNPSPVADRDENDSPPPPPLPASPPPLPSSPPPLPSLTAPSLMQEDLSIEEEMVTVEYSSSVNFSAAALSPPSMRTIRHNSSGEDGGLSSSDAGLGSDLHLGINGINGDDHRVDSSDNDSDLTDSDGEDQNGKYEIFSPGDSGIMTTSSIATTPDESDSNIELVNYTPTNTVDITTNNNYITTNYNFVNRSNAASNDDLVTTTTTTTTQEDNNITTNGEAFNSSNSSPASISLPSSQTDAATSNQPIIETSITPSMSHRNSSSPFISSNASPKTADEEVIIPSVKASRQMTSPSTFTSNSSSPKTSQETKENNKEGNINDSSFSQNSNNYNNSKNDVDLNHDEDESSFRSSLPKWSDKGEDKVTSPRNLDIMAKARHFADMVQPKQVIILKSEVITKTTNEARGLSKDPNAKEVEPLFHQTSLEDVAKQRKDIINQATTRKRVDGGATHTAGVSNLQQRDEDTDEDAVSHITTFVLEGT